MYLRLSEEANSVHVCFVFGPDGQIIGRQEKVHLSVDEMRFCQAGEGLTALETEVGRIGILIGEDALFPESGRLLAFQNCDMLVNLAACDGAGAFHQLRHAFVARLDENELLGAQSCLVGPNRLTGSGQDYVGKSGLLAPIPLSPRHDGVLFEMGAMTVEGIIAEKLDLAAMRLQWTEETPRLRQGMRMLAYEPMSAAYRELRSLDQVYYDREEPHEIPITSVADIPMEPPSAEEEEALPETSTPLDVEPKPAEEDDMERRDLDLRGSQESGFDLLASPFSQDDTEKDED